MEPLTKIQPKLRKNFFNIFKNIRNKLNNQISIIEDTRKNLDNKEYISNMITFLINSILKIVQDLNKYDIDIIEQYMPELNSNWLSELIEEITFKFITNRTDLHYGNLGLTHYNKLRYFDPTHNEERSGDREIWIGGN